MDWNWFFSAMAQSGAAIIGFIGAFIISKLIDLNEKVALCVDDFNNRLVDKSDLKRKSLKINIHQYNKFILTGDKKLIPMIQNGNFDNMNAAKTKAILKEKLGIFPSDKILINYFFQKYGDYIIYSNDDQQNKQRKIERRMGRIPINPSNLNNALQIRNDFEDFRLSVIKQLEGFRILSLKLNSYIESLRSIKNIINLLFLSIIILVIYPLHFLPISINQKPEIVFSIGEFLTQTFTLQGILLSLFVIIIFSILLVFRKNLKMTSNKAHNSIQKLKEEMEISTYSEHLDEQ